LVAVSGADCGEHGPAQAGLQAGAQVHVNCGELPAWAGLGLLFAVQRRPRGRPGAVLSLMGSDGLSLQVDIGVNASNQPCLRLDLTGTVTLPELPLPDHEWLLLNLAFTPAGLMLRTAICRANLPGGLPQTWQNAALVARPMPTGSPGQITWAPEPTARPQRTFGSIWCRCCTNPPLMGSRPANCWPATA